jgi:hypothetical protein
MLSTTYASWLGIHEPFCSQENCHSLIPCGRFRLKNHMYRTLTRVKIGQSQSPIEAIWSSSLKWWKKKESDFTPIV